MRHFPLVTWKSARCVVHVTPRSYRRCTTPRRQCEVRNGNYFFSSWRQIVAIVKSEALFIGRTWRTRGDHRAVSTQPAPCLVPWAWHHIAWYWWSNQKEVRRDSVQASVGEEEWECVETIILIFPLTSLWCVQSGHLARWINKFQIFPSTTLIYRHWACILLLHFLKSSC